MPTLKGTEASLSYVQCFLYLVSASVSLDTLWTQLILLHGHLILVTFIVIVQRFKSP